MIFVVKLENLYNVGDRLQLLIDFVEDKISAKDFLDKFYNDDKLQSVLECETEIPPYTNCGNLCLYVFESNASNFNSIYDLKHSIKQFLEKQEASFKFVDKMDKNFDILLSSLPKWLDIPSDYFISILDNETLSKHEKKEQIKLQVKKDFHYLKKPPMWLQGCEWKFVDGKPLFFIGELDVVPEKDRARIYVFFNKDDKTYHIINQSD